MLNNILFAITLGACVVACAELKPAARTAKDVAFTLCELVGTEQATDGQIDGVSVSEWCKRAEVIKPFLDDILAALMAGKARLAPTPPAEDSANVSE